MVTASFGVAALPTDATDAMTLIAAADQALYMAKASGATVSCVPQRVCRSSLSLPAVRVPGVRPGGPGIVTRGGH